MENNFFVFLISVVTAIAVENALLFRVQGLNVYVLGLKSPKQGLIYGGVFTLAAVVSSLLISLANELMAGNPYISYIRPPIYLVCISLVYVTMYLGTQRFIPPVFAAIKGILPVSIFNTALFGAFYVSAINSLGFLQTLGYAFGTGIGYTAAIFIIYYAKKQIAFCAVPRSFRGLPVLLLYIGLLSLALYGLIGHGLPT